MIAPRHDKDGFFKYYTAASAKLTLLTGVRKWSSPSLFNDPFDNQFDLDFPDPSDELAAEQAKEFLALLTSSEPIGSKRFADPETAAMMEYLRQVHEANPDFKYSDDELAEINDGALESMHKVKKIAPAASAEIRRVMADTSIFCVSERNDSILMWSHYAGNHTGVVIKFLALAEVDSSLTQAQPVRYSTEIPCLNYGIMLDSQRGRIEILETLTLSKSDVWSYEQEWRVWSSMRDKTRTHEILPYAPEEVGEVYLGCRMADKDKTEIIEITRRKYPKAKIFQADKHNTKYELVFDELNTTAGVPLYSSTITSPRIFFKNIRGYRKPRMA